MVTCFQKTDKYRKDKNFKEKEAKPKSFYGPEIRCLVLVSDNLGSET